MKIRKAVIPAAGLGTRMLPATKSQPKEMLTIVDKPVIQYVVEDAVRSGIRDILIVIGKGKDAIEHHFDMCKIFLQRIYQVALVFFLLLNFSKVILESRMIC